MPSVWRKNCWGGGAFEVSVNGEKIHSKLQTGQFPEPDAILKKVRAKR